MFLNKDSLHMDNISMGKYLTQAKFGYHKLWSKDSGRALSGKQSGTLIGIFPKFTLSFRSLTESELTYLTPHFDNPRQVIKYQDPNKNKELSIETYSGDWEIVYKNLRKGQPFDLSFIAIDRRK